ncbi:P63C domain-containing protein [Sphingobacterium multivorum]|uniref:P63C domain-containing protein n=1 Tax=Sphingobacterium multivorum TaxID=28454 RepID=UPI002FDB92F9
MENKVLKATHEGELQLGDKMLSCAVLDDGTRILTASAVFKAFDRPRKGKSNEGYRADQMPSFLNANNLQVFVDEQLKGWTELIPYTGISGTTKSGYNARILRGICKVYMDARNAGALHASQEKLAVIAESLLYALSDIGITALVDEVTGYQYEREKDALQIALKAYIGEELLKWQKMFPDTFYYEIFRLNDWDYTVNGINKRPGVIGKWTKELIYKQLPKGVLEELEARTPKSPEGNYTARFFQSLTPDIGHPALTAQLYKVIGLMNISNNWNEFKTHFNKMVDRKNGQMELDFDRIERELN